MHRYTLFLHSCSCTIISAYWHICRYLQICRYADIFADMQIDVHSWPACSETGESYLFPLGKCSPAQGICKTAFLKHPRRFWLQKGHGAWLTEVLSPFSRQFLAPPKCVQLLCVLPSYILSSYIWLLIGSWGKKLRVWSNTADGNCGKAAHFMIHETVLTVFLLSQPSQKSQFSFVVKTN